MTSLTCIRSPTFLLKIDNFKYFLQENENFTPEINQSKLNAKLCRSNQTQQFKSYSICHQNV